MNPLIRRIIYPALMLGTVALHAAFTGANVPPSLSALFSAGSMIALVSILEKRHPFEATWNEDSVELSDAILFLITMPVAQLVSVGLERACGGIGWQLHVWPTQWPVVFQILAAILVSDVCAYAMHRALHENALLFQLHQMQHTPQRLYWLNSFRNHPLDIALTSAATLLPLVLLNVPSPVVVWVSLISTVHFALQHANIDYDLGIFSFVISGAQAHRWHHSDKIEESQNNYGELFLFWDLIFKTHFYSTSRTRPESLGLGSGNAEI
jgi:sterol desaturase/sphingolipid hydroxylase (fatty acid hydroxylase superfamily)